LIGRRLLHFEITEELGEGGMGVVYKARDTHLDRFVALKVLPPEKVADPHRKARFVKEAKSASALNHPNIVAVYDIDQADGVDFIAMEFVGGKTLGECIPPGGLPVAEAVRYAAELSGAVAAAHSAGIAHRDLKPANVMIGAHGEVKVLDFGLAKLTERQEGEEAPNLTTETAAGMIVGTPAYMSPEQAAGRPVDIRTDVFSLGVLLYEMLTGVSVFHRDSAASTLAAVLLTAPPPLASKRKDVPAELERIVERCLEKDREQRYASAVELHQAIRAFRESLMQRASGPGALLRQPKWLAAGAILLAAVTMLAAWAAVRAQRAGRARNTILPEAARLIEAGQRLQAFRLLGEARRVIPDDAELKKLDGECSVASSFSTDPPGAEVSWKAYGTPDAAWEPLGKSPVNGALLPNEYLRWRIQAEGFEPAEVAGYAGAKLVFPLTRKGDMPEMVRIPAGSFRFLPDVPIRLEAYRLDKYEVTNREYKAFVDKGGYQKREFWKHPFIDGERTLSWEEAMARFRDATGRPGPAAWQVGSWPEGQEDLPVGGVSWYEAAAYAEFAGKALPTIYHWRRAAAGANFEVAELSNFSGRGPAKAGSYRGLSPFGNYDMAGNLKEWCSTGSQGLKLTLGASWNDPPYMFADTDKRNPMDRSPAFGFRCAKYEAPVAPKLLADLETKTRDYRKEKPVPDEVYRGYQALYAYDRTPLEPALETIKDNSEYWRHEKAVINAAYGQERFAIQIFVPKNAKPPYQTVVYFPGSHAFLQTGPSDQVSPASPSERTAFLVRTGRVLVCPTLFRMYERKRQGPVVKPDSTSVAMRDIVVNCYKDLARTLDYLETRSDIDMGKVAYYGVSFGATSSPVFLSQDRRYRTGVLISGGLWHEPYAAEIDPLNFAARCRTPMLMVNGRYDAQFTIDGHQLPLLHLLGAAEKDKKHVLFDGGHDLPQVETMKEVLAWLDRYLGPVQGGQ
jgi:formylglycine-generating enzyme required for sulfatase activity/predicted Ser/Thr protein kinase/dienelactone hydrolase